MFASLFGPKAKTVTPATLQQLMTEHAIHLIDVREPAEFRDGHIAGAANVPLNTLPRQVMKLPKDRPLVFYCRSGGRSGSAVNICRQLGLPHDTHLGGGIIAWSSAGLPLAR